ncbi:predicted protein [Aspergillus terreus NIH2624]|uniref:Uncharacterized protein n=1 Tax=Aspergillus terreus (strain NIH 2624 / FGSC A1156) TaxID=341663 RepID=Q0CKU0_ASPTN|nr:uncharacterized protein ATEG_05694 [Aspergillus terreus NIH2624]EAU33455.1 predicted protein [Aspergillus terreus NIH2624]
MTPCTKPRVIMDHGQTGVSPSRSIQSIMAANIIPGRRTSPCSVASITATASRLCPYLPTDNLDGYDSEDSLLHLSAQYTREKLRSIVRRETRQDPRQALAVLFNAFSNDPVARGNPRLPFAHRSNTSANDRILQSNGTSDVVLRTFLHAPGLAFRSSGGRSARELGRLHEDPSFTGWTI